MDDQRWILITKHFSGELSEHEKAEFIQWMNAADENRKLYQEVEQIWNTTGKIPFRFQPDTKKAWEKVKLKIKPATKVIDINTALNKDNNTKQYLQNFLKVAAAILVLVGCSLLIKLVNGNQKGSSEIAATFQAEEKKSFVQLPDGSKVWLNKNTTLSYAKNFNSEERIINMTGEAFFEVARDEKRPFVIHSGNSTSRVLGTGFNIRAYEKDKTTELIVAHGKVSFTLNQGEVTKEVILEKDEKGIINKDNKAIVKVLNDDPNYLAWKNEKIIFNKTQLSKVASTLTSYFYKEIIIESPELINCHFSGSFDKPQLNDVLEVLKITMKMNYKEEQGKIVFFCEVCQPN